MIKNNFRGKRKSILNVEVEYLCVESTREELK